MWTFNLPRNLCVSPQLSVLSRQVGDLQADNLKLYEKIRFLQVISENKIKYHIIKCSILLRQNIASQSNVEYCWEQFFSGLWRGKQEKWGGGSSWEQACHIISKTNSCLNIISLVSYLDMLVGTGTRRVMSRNWTPSPTSASKKSRGSMASSLFLRRCFIFYSSLGK